MENLNQWELESSIVYNEGFLTWYDANKELLEKKLQSDSMADMHMFLTEHPERKRAYWYKMWDSTDDANYLIEDLYT